MLSRHLLRTSCLLHSYEKELEKKIENAQERILRAILSEIERFTKKHSGTKEIFYSFRTLFEECEKKVFKQFRHEALI